MGYPTPRTALERQRDVNERLTLLERRQTPLAAPPTDPTPLATETVAGKAQLADSWEAHLWPEGPGGVTNLTSTIMTPQRTMEMLEWFAPKVGMTRTSFAVEDWNTTIEVGFYKAYYDTPNSPPGGEFNAYLGTVHSSDHAQYNAGGSGYIVQDVWEIEWNGSALVVPRKWLRIRDSDETWGTWTEPPGGAAASETRAGIVELATLLEVLAGTDATRVITPATLSARTATDARTGLVELATPAEVATGSDSTRVVTPNSLLSRTSTATRIGLVELATPAEALAGTDATRAVTPQGLKGVADTKAALVHTHTASQITDFAPAVDARIAEAGSLRMSGTSTQRENLTGMPIGLSYYETDTTLEWTWTGLWRLKAGQTLASMIGPVGNTVGAGVLVGSIIRTPVLPIGQRVRIMSSFSQYKTVAGIGIVRTVWRNSATDVSFATFDGRVSSRAYSPSNSAVVSGRGCSAMFTTTVAERISAAVYTEVAADGVYGADQTHLWIESA